MRSALRKTRQMLGLVLDLYREVAVSALSLIPASASLPFSRPCRSGTLGSSKRSGRAATS